MLREISKYKNEYGCEPDIKELSNILKISEDEVMELQNIYKESLEEFKNSEEEIKHFSISDLSHDEYKELVELIQKNGHLLNDQEREILLLSFGLIDDKKWSYKELAIRFNKTEERIRQIVAKGIRKVRHPEKIHKLSDYL